MQGKVTLEDHFATEATVDYSRRFGPHVWQELRYRLLDLQERRLHQMDQGGVEIMILSLNAPGVQAISEVARGVEVARQANDTLASEIAKRPDRFAGFAALPMQDPEAAMRELERCIGDLGFKGALVNGYTVIDDKPVHYDTPAYRPFWRALEALDVPLYLHPRPSMPGVSPLYEGQPWLFGPTWSFAAETALHALRLIGCGLFDDCPRLRIVLGHLAEGLPFYLWRIDNANSWIWKNAPPRNAAKKRVSDYFRSNFYLTTSGHFNTPELIDSIAEIGVDRVMFSIDYPFEDVSDAATWFDNIQMSEADRHKIGRANAMKLFKLKGA